MSAEAEGSVQIGNAANSSKTLNLPRVEQANPVVCKTTLVRSVTGAVVHFSPRSITGCLKSGVGSHDPIAAILPGDILLRPVSYNR
jgi:hypothetical protein